MVNIQSVPSAVTFGRAEVNGIRMYYRMASAGEPVVLLHGFPETSHAWRKIIPALAEHYTVIAPDLRGFGDPDRPETGYDKRTVAEDVHQLIHQLGLGPISLVSHDVGMMVGYAYASAYPSEVKRLVLMEAALPGLGLEKLYDAHKFPRMYHLPLFEAPNGLAEALITGREKMFVRHFMRQQAYSIAALEDDVLDGYADQLAAPGALRAGIAYFRTHKVDAEHNHENAKIKLPMPVMTVAGAASAGSDLEGAIRPLVRHMRAAVIENCGHYIAEEQPERLIEELLGFFREGISGSDRQKTDSTPQRTVLQNIEFSGTAIIGTARLSNRDILDTELGRHLMSHAVEGSGEVIENIGETELPWHIFYHNLAEGAEIPSAWDTGFPIHFAAEIVDTEGMRVGYSILELRDDKDGLHMKLTSHLPAAAPPWLRERHLHHFNEALMASQGNGVFVS